MRNIAAGVLLMMSIGTVPCRSQELMQFRFEAVDVSGSPLETVRVGDEFELRVHIRDTRPAALGIVSAYLDVDYDPQLISYVPDSFVFGGDFGEIPSGDASPAGVLDEMGSFIDGILTLPPLPNPVGIDETLFLLARFRADQVGSALIEANPADNVPLHSITMHGLNDGIAAENVHYDSIVVTIVPEPAAVVSAGCGLLLTMLLGAHRRAARRPPGRNGRLS